MVHNEFEFDKQVFHICVDNDTYGYYPVFCSVNCLMGHISNSNLNKVVLIHNAKMIQHFWSRYFQFEEKECSLQTKPRYLLNMFGGTDVRNGAENGLSCHDGHAVCNIQEFRQGSCRFIDQRPNQKTAQSIETSQPKKDLIYWPNAYPHLDAAPTHIPGLSSSALPLPLTSMEDPSEVFMAPATIHESEPKTEPQTVTMISKILQQTIDTKKLQEVSDALSSCRLTSTTPMTPVQPARKMQDSKSRTPPNANKTPRQEPKRRKISKANSPPARATVSSTSTYAVHPLFGGGARTVTTARGKKWLQNGIFWKMVRMYFELILYELDHGVF